MSNVNGITIDVEKLASGLLEMIDDHPDGACMSLGMFPADIMTVFDRQLARKVPDHYVYDGCEFDGKETRRKITHMITVEILKQATESGVCKV